MDDDGGRPENFIEQFRIDRQAVLHHLIDGDCWVLLMLGLILLLAGQQLTVTAKTNQVLTYKRQ